MADEPTKAWDKLLGANTSGLLSLGAVAGGLIYVGLVVGDFAHRLERVEERSTVAERCASTEQCEIVKRAIEGLEHRTAKLEWKTGATP